MGGRGWRRQLISFLREQEKGMPQARVHQTRKTVPLSSLVLAAPSRKGEEHMSTILALGGQEDAWNNQGQPRILSSQLGTHSRRWREGEDEEAKMRLVELFPSLTAAGQCPTGNTYTLAKDRWSTDQLTPRSTLPTTRHVQIHLK